mmetsp:Transcript_7394/g.12485  ORF Transcript_7394/g.12485 Transcript_7394/m.12485 type:complete len:84 (+) Transcript_7394:346-597(+)
MIVFGLVSGLNYPMLSSYLMFAYFIGTLAKASVSSSIGSKGAFLFLRMFGFWIQMCGMLGLMYYSLKGSLQVCGVLGVDKKGF